MKKYLFVIIKANHRILVVLPLIVGLILLPLVIYGQAGTNRIASIPPVEQPLVPEGAFAVELAQALKIGRVQDKAQAESMLSDIGIEPKNGEMCGQERDIIN